MLHQVGVSFDLYYDARKHKIKIRICSGAVRLMIYNEMKNICGKFEAAVSVQKILCEFKDKQLKLYQDMPSSDRHLFSESTK